jgi:hypothetical protein
MIRIQFLLFSLSALLSVRAQTSMVNPQVRTRLAGEGKVMTVELMPYFVTTIQAPEAVNSLVVGNPDAFLVEHSEREPNLVFAKPLTTSAAETNLLITTVHGRHIVLLLSSRGLSSTSAAERARVDFFLRYGPGEKFVIEPEMLPLPLVPQTSSLGVAPRAQESRAPSPGSIAPASLAATNSKIPVPGETSLARQRDAELDQLLKRQRLAPLPALHGQASQNEASGKRLRAGISEVIDQGQEVVVLFSVVNVTRGTILLMPPQVQLGGRQQSGTLIKHEKWTAAEELPILDFRMSRRRVEARGRADGVVVFTRPPYKQSSEMLFLQMAESGAVDRPALVPIGFGVSRLRQEENHDTKE